ncbi:hypothetical protein RE6C_04233 [Rhodopirellula europaea 6C]|uniref:Uncharacterized protein n=1 Tax=Rhodopirellula europaea 6C TaxID=1263867 RepID=M2AZT1_9BACT|nr:hypothetical protein RE6C_04233 [Rhodopirellula europaea 6C]
MHECRVSAPDTGPDLWDDAPGDRPPELAVCWNRIGHFSADFAPSH